MTCQGGVSNGGKKKERKKKKERGKADTQDNLGEDI
jgi:hypothetical protein